MKKTNYESPITEVYSVRTERRFLQASQLNTMNARNHTEYFMYGGDTDNYDEL